MMKSRPVKINESVYIEVRNYCDINALKISRWISKVLLEKLNERKNVDERMSKSKKQS